MGNKTCDICQETKHEDEFEAVVCNDCVSTCNSKKPMTKKENYFVDPCWSCIGEQPCDFMSIENNRCSFYDYGFCSKKDAQKHWLKIN